MEEMQVFNLLEIRKCGQLQLCVAGILEPDKIQTEQQGSSWRSSASRKGEKLQLWEVFKIGAGITSIKNFVRNKIAQD